MDLEKYDKLNRGVFIKHFQKGDYVYFFSKRHGTIPAVIQRIGKGKNHAHCILIKGNFPSGDYINWVHESNIEHQKPGCDMEAINCARCGSDGDCVYQS